MSAQSRLARIPRSVVIAVAVASTVVVMVSGGFAVGAFGTHDPDAPSRITVGTNELQFTFSAPPHTAMTAIDQREQDGCEVIVIGMNKHHLALEAVPADCRPENESALINGRHGTYRTLDDVGEPKDVEQVSTGLGEAELFVQDYDEYTNSHNSYQEPVAIVTFDEPVNPDYPTLVVRSGSGDMEREEFTEMVESFDVPTRLS